MKVLGRGIVAIAIVVVLALWGFGVFNSNPPTKDTKAFCWARAGVIDHRVNGKWVATYSSATTNRHCDTKGAGKVNGQWVNSRTGLPING